MKSFFTVSFLVTILLTASTALSYDCYEREAPVRHHPCSQCQKPQCSQHHQPCPTRCGQCDKCRTHKRSCQKQVVHQQNYQCETTYTKKTEQITTVQCRSCGQIHPRDIAHRCGKVQCRTCGVHHPQGTKHHCGEVRCKSCGIHYHQNVGHHCRARCQHRDCFRENKKSCRHEGKQCATRGCNLTRKESQETMETRWHAWFKNQAQ